MKTATKTPPIDKLSKRIAALSILPPDPTPRVSLRLAKAIRHLKWHLCGLFGVRIETVTDRHAAELAQRVCRDWSYCHEQFNGIGFTTMEELLVWSKAELK